MLLALPVTAIPDVLLVVRGITRMGTLSVRLVQWDTIPASVVARNVILAQVVISQILLAARHVLHVPLALIVIMLLPQPPAYLLVPLGMVINIDIVKYALLVTTLTERLLVHLARKVLLATLKVLHLVHLAQPESIRGLLDSSHATNAMQGNTVLEVLRNANTAVLVRLRIEALVAVLIAL